MHLVEGPEDLKLLDSMTVAEAMASTASITELMLLVLCKTPAVKVVAATNPMLRSLIQSLTEEHSEGDKRARNREASLRGQLAIAKAEGDWDR